MTIPERDIGLCGPGPHRTSVVHYTLSAEELRGAFAALKAPRTTGKLLLVR
jgi:hypothetical protein